MLVLWGLLGNICGGDTVKEIGSKGADSRPEQVMRGRDFRSRALHLSHGKADSAMYPDTYHSTSTSITGEQAPGLHPLDLDEMRTSVSIKSTPMLS